MCNRKPPVLSSFNLESALIQPSHITVSKTQNQLLLWTISHFQSFLSPVKTHPLLVSSSHHPIGSNQSGFNPFPLPIVSLLSSFSTLNRSDFQSFSTSNHFQPLILFCIQSLRTTNHFPFPTLSFLQCPSSCSLFLYLQYFPKSNLLHISVLSPFNNTSITLPTLSHLQSVITSLLSICMSSPRDIVTNPFYLDFPTSIQSFPFSNQGHSPCHSPFLFHAVHVTPPPKKTVANPLYEDSLLPPSILPHFQYFPTSSSLPSPIPF